MGGGGRWPGYTREYSEVRRRSIRRIACFCFLGENTSTQQTTNHNPQRVSRYVEELGPAVHFAVSSGGEFCAKVIGEVPESVVSSFRLTPGARCRRKKRRWYFPMAAHNTLKAALGRVRERVRACVRKCMRTGVP